MGVLGGAAVLARYSLGVVAWRVANGLEKPTYSVVKKLGRGVELRRYDAFSVAEVTFKRPATMKAVTSQGFRKCAGYIFGKNRRRGARWGAGAGAAEKMAMTSPVRMEVEMAAPKGGEGTNVDYEEVKVSFVMASNYSLASLPVPKDSDVKLRTVQPHSLAAVKFSGPPPSEERVKRKQSLVLQQLAKAQLKERRKQQQREKALVYGYHDPFLTPNLLRRNEVAVVVDV